MNASAFPARAATIVPANAAPLPVIQARAGDLPALATESERSLIAAETPFYIRGGLVRPIIDEVAAAHGRKTKVARLKVVDLNVMIDHMARAASWVKYNARKNGLVPADPPPQVAAIILSRDGEWRFKRLAGVITTPTLRPDGTLLTEPGYDERTQLLLMHPPVLPPIPLRPSRDDAMEAAKLLDGLLAEFPFVDDASRSVALSALITPVVRGAMAVAPMHVPTAPVPGSGKSYIIDLCSAIATGERAPVISAGRTEEETEKRLGAALLNGQAIISIDNVNGELSGDALCQMIERPVVSLRPLGMSQLIKIESRATWFATGNNIQLVGDLTRRALLCSLDPGMERPELRAFQGEPLELVFADRGRYVAAALTISRAYIVAGCPGQLRPLASFEEWSRLVRSALVWLGYADPVETIANARASDPIVTSLHAVLASWYAAVGSSPRTTGAIKDAAFERDPLNNIINGALQEALLEVADDKRGGIDTRRLGKFLGRYAGRVVDGMKLVGGDDAHAKQKTWKVVRV